MAGKDDGTTGGLAPENSLLAPQTMDRFQGYATKDGELITEKTPKGAQERTPKRAVAAASGDDDDDDDTQDDDADKSPEERAADKRHRSAQDRISKATAKQRAAERRADDAERRATASEARIAALEASRTTPLTQQSNQNKRDPNAPSPTDYKNGDIDARYIADLARYEGRKAAEDARAVSDKAAKDREAAVAQREMTKKVDTFKDKGAAEYDDFEEVVFDDDTPISPTIGELALDSEHGTQIMYELASDLKEAKKVKAMTPARQAAWFGQQESRISSESPDADADEDEDEPEERPARRSTKKAPKTTRAPAPSEYQGRGGGSNRVNAATNDFAAFERQAMGRNK